MWLTHYNQLCDKWLEVVREKCTGCQTCETNYLVHELCLLVSTEEQVNLCFEEIYGRVSRDDVMESWYKKVLEMPIALNPETLAILERLSILMNLHTRIDIKKWLIESSTIDTAPPTTRSLSIGL